VRMNIRGGTPKPVNEGARIMHKGIGYVDLMLTLSMRSLIKLIA